jgi:hypothetical protein
MRRKLSVQLTIMLAVYRVQRKFGKTRMQAVRTAVFNK